jgi:hypothetical protein
MIDRKYKKVSSHLFGSCLDRFAVRRACHETLVTEADVSLLMLNLVLGLSAGFDGFLDHAFCGYTSQFVLPVAGRLVDFLIFRTLAGAVDGVTPGEVVGVLNHAVFGHCEICQWLTCKRTAQAVNLASVLVRHLRKN